jgi:hypothetical protein
MSLNERMMRAATRELRAAFPERGVLDAGHDRLARAIAEPQSVRCFYLVPLTPQTTALTHRYAAYESTAGGLRVVWAKTVGKGTAASGGQQVPAYGQVRCDRHGLPEYHYAVEDDGKGRPQQIGEYLQEHVGRGVEIEVFVLGGESPHSVYRTQQAVTA